MAAFSCSLIDKFIPRGKETCHVDWACLDFLQGPLIVTVNLSQCLSTNGMPIERNEGDYI